MIIDDEQLAIDVLEILLSKIKGIEIIGKYTDPQIALADIPKLHADVAFVDMEMGELHGLELADIIQSKYPNHLEIVFVTAYPQFALDAFEVNAIDYLLKPVMQERLEQTVEKLEKRLGNYQESRKGIEQKKEELFVQVLGSFRLIDTNGNEVKWRTRKVKELFVYLWHQQEKGVHRSELISHLWPEATEDRAAALMHTTVYQLRKAIREIGFEKPVILRNGHYILNIHINSDLDQLNQLLTSPTMNMEKIEEILELYHGNYLEIEDYDWAFSKQETIKGLLLLRLEEFVSTNNDFENQRNLIEVCLKKMIQLEPYNEQYAYWLLDYYGRNKDLEKMVNTFQGIKEKWIDDLGVDIPIRLQDLYVEYIM